MILFLVLFKVTEKIIFFFINIFINKNEKFLFLNVLNLNKFVL